MSRALLSRRAATLGLLEPRERRSTDLQVQDKKVAGELYLYSTSMFASSLIHPWKQPLAFTKSPAMMSGSFHPDSVAV